jgi:hypothetical protein
MIIGNGGKRDTDGGVRHGNLVYGDGCCGEVALDSSFADEGVEGRTIQGC